MSKIIKNGNVVLNNSVICCDLKIENEIISEIGTNIEDDNSEYIDATGRFVLPGAIDAHTHLDLDTGLTKTADDFESGSKAAIIGGTTTIVDFATQEKGGTLKSAFKEWSKKAKNTYCDYAFHMAIIDWNENVKKEMSEMIKLGITSFKMYMAYKGSLQVDDSVIYDALKESSKIGALMGFHCENGDLIDAKIKENLSKGNTSPYYHMDSRPPSFESEAIQRLLVIADAAKAPVWVVHLSTKEGLKFIKRAKLKGQIVVTETCPQYLIMDSSYYGTPKSKNFSTAKYVMSPPLRTKENLAALWEGLSTGAIDFISTDHCSFSLKGQKELGKNDFSKIPNGGAGIEDRLSVIYTYAVCKNKMTINEMVNFLSKNPAKFMGLENKGTLEIGKDADIVLFNPFEKSIFSAQTQTQKLDYNSYEGMEKLGKVEHTFLRGKQLVKNGEIAETKAFGIYQKRNTCKF